MTTLERTGYATLILLVTLTAAGCAAPFSDLQSAGTLAPGESEITGHYSYVQARGEGESEKAQDNFGIQAARGLSDRVELRGRYEFVSAEGLDLVSAVAVGPKVSLIRDRLSIYSPIGTGFGGGLETSEAWQWQPTLLYTIPVNDGFEINTSGKAQVWLNNDADNLLAFNLGLGVVPGGSDWKVRPEVGVLVNPGEDGSFWHFSVGLSRQVGR